MQRGRRELSLGVVPGKTQGAAYDVHGECSMKFSLSALLCSERKEGPWLLKLSAWFVWVPVVDPGTGFICTLAFGSRPGLA